MAGNNPVDMEAVEDEVKGLLERMTLEEKACLLTGLDFWHLRGVERLGVEPGVRCTDCGHGVTPLNDTPINGTCFPTGVGQAATWNANLLEELGGVLGSETRALGSQVLLAPKVTLHRLPVGGRNFETYSEDPLLAGKLGAAVIRGIQSRGAAACVKAFTANNQQVDQSSVSVEVDERTLREIYCTAFRICIEEAGPLALMTSYNRVNGDYASANRHLIRDIVKEDWGYRGVVLSDWRGVHGPESIAAGLDLEMPGPGKFMRTGDIMDALERGELSEADLDDRAGRVLRLILACRRDELPAAEGPDTPSHGRLARRVAEESIVLLKNEGALLPVDRDALRTVAVIGPNAREARLGGMGSASVCPPYAVGPLQGLIEATEGQVEISHEEGCCLIGTCLAIPSGALLPPSGCEGEGLRAEYFRRNDLAGTPYRVEYHEQVDFSWGWASAVPGLPVHNYGVRWSGRIRARESGTHGIGAFTAGGGFRLYINGELALDEWSDPDEDATCVEAEATCDLRLEAGETLDVRLEYGKVCHPAAVRLVWREPGGIDGVQRAAEAAARADLAVVCAGLSNVHEGGTMDRADMGLPGDQNRLIREVAAANPRTVVVLFGGNPLDMTSWIDEVPAVLQAWYPGQEGGNALAHILFGDVNPSGKLPDTFWRRLEDCPAWPHYPGDGQQVHYSEGLFTGYRRAENHRRVEPLFPFGYGLSYTSFRLDGLRISSDTLKNGETLNLSVDLTNTGDRTGKEVLQLYVREKDPAVRRPLYELKGFCKVELQAGETREINFTLCERDLAFYDVERKSWRARPGEFEARVGSHSRDGLSAGFRYCG